MCVCFMCLLFRFFFFKQKTAYEMRISDWSSDVCSSDLLEPAREGQRQGRYRHAQQLERHVLTASVPAARRDRPGTKARKQGAGRRLARIPPARTPTAGSTSGRGHCPRPLFLFFAYPRGCTIKSTMQAPVGRRVLARSEEHTSELQYLMRKP